MEPFVLLLFAARRARPTS